MAKIEKVVEELVTDLSPESMQVVTGKGKKQVIDEDKTFANIAMNLSYYRGLMDGLLAVSDQVKGLEEALEPHITSFDELYVYAEENHEEALAEFVEQFGIESFGSLASDESEEGEEDDPFDYLATLELVDVKAVAKALEVKVMKKDTVETLVEKIGEVAEADELAETLEELGLYEDEDPEEEPEDEPEDDDAINYAEMSLGDLRKLCKERDIKYTPKEKVDDLVAKLEEADGEEVEEDEPEDETEDYTAYSLAELRTECKERGIKYTPKEKSVDLIAKLVADDKAEDETEEEPDEDVEDAVDYSAMSLGDLRKLCKERSIKYTPKEKVDDLVAKLEEADGEENTDEEDVPESELDSILDEEFEDETMESERASAGGNKAADKKAGRKVGRK